MSRLAPRALGAALLVATLALGACGRGSSDATADHGVKGVRSLLSVYAQAGIDRNYTKLCSLLAPDILRQLGGQRTCEGKLKSLPGGLPSGPAHTLKDNVQKLEISLNGDRARIHVPSGIAPINARGGDFAAVYVSGHWRVTSGSG